jgi:hypothetical protein
MAKINLRLPKNLAYVLTSNYTRMRVILTHFVWFWHTACNRITLCNKCINLESTHIVALELCHTACEFNTLTCRFNKQACLKSMEFCRRLLLKQYIDWIILGILDGVYRQLKFISQTILSIILFHYSDIEGATRNQL